jgi:hypothetical protein
VGTGAVRRTRRPWGTNNVAALAERLDGIHTAGVAAGTSTTGILFECATLAQWL